MNAVVESKAPAPPQFVPQFAALLKGQRPQPPAVPPGGCPNLQAALAQARDRIHAVGKDAYNAFHKYHYASAESILEAALEAMKGTGLAFFPARTKLATLGGNVYSLQRVIVLTHSSGEFLPLEIEDWPVHPDRGRPLDKAFAAALTTSLAYLLRDLLQMPRVAEGDDVSAREDRPQPAPEQKRPPRDPRAKVAEADDRLAKAGVCQPGALLSRVEAKLGKDCWRPERWEEIKDAATVARAELESAGVDRAFPPRAGEQAPAEVEPAARPAVYERACDYERALVKRGLCVEAELTQWLRKTFAREGRAEDWPESLAGEVAIACKQFHDDRKAARAADEAQITTEEVERVGAELERVGWGWGRAMELLGLDPDHHPGQLKHHHAETILESLAGMEDREEVAF